MSSAQTNSPAKQAQPHGYTVLARRYRSRGFDELIGQKPIAQTLRNAIATGRIAHAYLFTGTRGVGKTSMARIFAKALNATENLSQREQVAEAILRGDDLDVIEIDGASNRGVQEARDLIAGAGLSPTRCPYKIYIIDEVHMLTKDAFNTLLKTMEEPPSHVKFILCTTEPHKVPATIQSRCQRFDFRALSSAEIAWQLKHVLDEEGIEADEEAVAQIARLGNGSMRDALSLLDRLIAAADGRLTADLIEQMLGLPDQSIVRGLIDAVIGADPARAIAAGNELLARGATIDQALEIVAEYLRTVLVAVTCGSDSTLLEVTSEQRDAASQQAAHFDALGLVHQIALCDATARNARNSSAARALFDACLVRMSLAERLADIATLLDQTSNAPAHGKKKAQPLPPQRDAEPLAPPPVERGEHRAARAIEVKAAADPTPPSTMAEIWDRTLEAATDSSTLSYAANRLDPVSLENGLLSLQIRPDAMDVARVVRSRAQSLQELVRRVSGKPLRVEIEAPAGPSDSAARGGEPTEDVSNLPVVAQAAALFDARVIAVERIQEQTASEDDHV